MPPHDQAQRALDLPKFERAVTTLTLEKDHEIQGLKETIDGLRETIERERAGYLTSDVAARYACCRPGSWLVPALPCMVPRLSLSLLPVLSAVCCHVAFICDTISRPDAPALLRAGERRLHCA
jgi:hypothetical protein